MESLIAFLTTVIGYLVSCIENVEELLYFLIDFPSLVVSVVITFPPFVVVGLTALYVFLCVAIGLKIYSYIR